MKTMRILLLAAIGSLLLAAGAQAALLLNNGGFETGDFTGWTLSGDTGHFDVTASSGGGSSHSGTYYGRFETYPVGDWGYIAQTVATSPGQTYSIDFWLKNGSTSPGQVVVEWNGGQVPGGLLSLSTVFDWTEYSYHGLVPASGSSTVFDLGFSRTALPYMLLDDVSVAVPEPSTWCAGMSVLLVLLGTLATKRLSAAAAKQTD